MSTAEITISIKQPLLTSPDWRHKLISRVFASVKYGNLVVRLDNKTEVLISGSEVGPAADISFHNLSRSLFGIWLKGDIGFAESYMAGQWDSTDLAQLMYFLSINLEALSKLDERSWLNNFMASVAHKLNNNSLSGSKKNIAAHYDLGNNFYSRWLDKSMTYSSAIFDQSYELEKAQYRKYERIFEQLDAAPGDHILEIGCGWGGFAEYAAKHGCYVTGITLSREQLSYAQNRINSAGLADRVQLEIRDYRHLEKQYDHIVSIEMIEAVGKEYWEGYFQTLKKCLKPGGDICIQSITIDESMYDDYEKNPGGFIQRYIFPGGMLPTKTHLKNLGLQQQLETIDTLAFGEDYATTLAAWHECFNREENWLEEHGYDERFRRMWRYYLAFCEGGFRDGRIDVVQWHYRHLD